MRSGFYPILLVLGVTALGWVALTPGRGGAPGPQPASAVTESASGNRVEAPLPWVLNVNHRRQVFVARGTVPDQAALDALAAAGLTGLRAVPGPAAPEWLAAALAGVAGLQHLTVGQFELAGRSLSLLGTARTPPEAEVARAAVTTGLPEGYAATVTLSVLDDLTPAAYRLRYAAGEAPYLEGKLPVGVTAQDVARALGLDDLDDGSQGAIVGEAGAVSPAFAVLRAWLPLSETLDLAVAPGETSVALGLGRGWDAAAVEAALRAALPGASVTVTAVEAVAPDGRERSTLSGGAEVLSGGYWLPVAPVAPSPDPCATAGEGALPAAQAALHAMDLRAPADLNALAGALRPCLEAGYRLRIVGGDPALAGAMTERLPGAAISTEAGAGAPTLVWQAP